MNNAFDLFRWILVTVYPESSYPPEKILNIFASENEVSPMN